MFIIARQYSASLCFYRCLGSDLDSAEKASSYDLAKAVVRTFACLNLLNRLFVAIIDDDEMLYPSPEG